MPQAGRCRCLHYALMIHSMFVSGDFLQLHALGCWSYTADSFTECTDHWWH